MNIFDQYKNNIKNILKNLSKKNKIILPKNLDAINTEIPPKAFNSDISTNVAMVLSKINKRSPFEIAKILVDEIKKNDELIDNISIVDPGFINIKLKKIFWTNFVKDVIKHSKKFGVNINKDNQPTINARKDPLEKVKSKFINESIKRNVFILFSIKYFFESSAANNLLKQIKEYIAQKIPITFGPPP